MSEHGSSKITKLKSILLQFLTDKQKSHLEIDLINLFKNYSMDISKPVTINCDCDCDITARLNRTISY